LTTVIKNGIVVAYKEGEHRLLTEGDVVFEGNRITYVGKHYRGGAEEKIDARGKLVIPGMLSLHAHTTSSHYMRSYIEDVGSRNFYMSGLYEYFPVIMESIGEREAETACKAAICELLRSGCTYFLEMGTANPEKIAEITTKAGIRACIIPGYRSAKWYTNDGKQVYYEWDEEEGFKGLERNIRFIKECGKYGGMVSSLLGPMQLDTCSVELLKTTLEKAKELDVKIQIHAAQSIVEFNEIMRRHGMTPIEFMHKIGLLTERTMIAHCVYISEHPHSLAPWGRDLSLLSNSGATVVHCPTVFMRRGAVLNSYSKYLEAGINIALGTDTVPHDILMEMRTAAYMAKSVEGNCFVATARQLFDSATIRGARALGRDDLGVLREGALADIVIINLKNSRMTPVRDPIKNLVYHATTSEVDEVIVDGRRVVSNGKVVTIDEEETAEELQSLAEKIWKKVGENDWAGRSVDELSPPSLKSY